MKQWMIPLLIIISVILTACSSGDTTGEDPENNTSEDAVSKPSEETAESEEQDLETEGPAEKETQQRDSEDTADNEESKENYTAAEHCIMTQLAECENVPPEDQFQAYRDLVADSTLPEAPGSDCLPCAVKYSFEAKYGESDPVNYSILPRSEKMPEDISDPSEFVQQYLFSLPAFFNNHDETALSFYQPDSAGYHALFANKASGNFSNHMTYSVFINSEVENLDGSINIYAYRTYSHINTNGIFEVYARYNLIEQDGRYYLTDYEELENTRIE
ncbi:hypothetical protein [Jeotgalicoccus sp. FSL K6-3177]|uniref:hypothetical protein n=1 Tax=Jeotgalicoccus sp. FSL K6-3177 TaxID=2921494 RepID=UPI0030FD678C